MLNRVRSSFFSRPLKGTLCEGDIDKKARIGRAKLLRTEKNAPVLLFKKEYKVDFAASMIEWRN